MKLLLHDRVLLHVKSAMRQMSTGVTLYQYSVDGERYVYGDKQALDIHIDRIKRQYPNVRTEGELPSTH